MAKTQEHKFTMGGQECHLVEDSNSLMVLDSEQYEIIYNDGTSNNSERMPEVMYSLSKAVNETGREVAAIREDDRSNNIVRCIGPYLTLVGVNFEAAQKLVDELAPNIQASEQEQTVRRPVFPEVPFTMGGKRLNAMSVEQAFWEGDREKPGGNKERTIRVDPNAPEETKQRWEAEVKRRQEEAVDKNDKER